MSRQSARDWWCTRCDFRIYGYKDVCGKCGSRRPGSAAPAASGNAGRVHRVGDWYCGSCGVDNNADRVACFKCKTAKVGVASNSSDGGDVVATAATRECVTCLQANELTIAFLPCGHVCMCATCAQRVQECPLCRAHITEKKKLYVS